MNTMPETPGVSVYLSTFDQQRPLLEPLRGTGANAFLSLHMREELTRDYAVRAEGVCRWLAEGGFRITADISAETMDSFGEPDPLRLAKRLGLWCLRVDCGLSDSQIARLAQRMPVAVNASTITPQSARALAKAGPEVIAMHNFYPRPETGLDDAFFRQQTQMLHDLGMRVTAFIPGDALLRGPLMKGLPTLERHRGIPPSACLADLTAHFDVDGVFIGDPIVSEGECSRIRRICAEDVVELPADLDEPYRSLYGQVFTCREDSPQDLIRFKESRAYAREGAFIEPSRCLARTRGAVTIDNAGYARYSGEIQIVRTDRPADPRINVIGQIAPSYLLAADAVRRGGKFVLSPRKAPAA